jgi:hypothetical protein
VKPELFDDPDVGSLPAAARWLFVGLLTQADRAGRLVNDPRRLKARLCAYDDTDVAVVLDILDRAGLVVLYEVEARPYVQIRTFNKHQHPHPKEPESKIPPIPAEFRRNAERNLLPRKETEGTVDSGFLILDSCTNRREDASGFSENENGKIPDHRVLCAIARAELAANPDLDFGSLADAVKVRLVAQGFDYPAPDAITGAIDAVTAAVRRST